MIDIKSLKKGDKVICIINSNTSLKIGNEYTIDDFYEDYLGEELILKNDKGELKFYSVFRFVPKSKFRELLIDDIQSNFSIITFCKKISRLIELRIDNVISYHETLENLQDLFEIIEKNQVNFEVDRGILHDDNLFRFSEENPIWNKKSS